MKDVSEMSDEDLAKEFKSLLKKTKESVDEQLAIAYGLKQLKIGERQNLERMKEINTERAQRKEVVKK